MDYSEPLPAARELPHVSRPVNTIVDELCKSDGAWMEAPLHLVCIYAVSQH
ncbi:hypothetical protein D3C87_2082340 [compost metagenome]